LLSGTYCAPIYNFDSTAHRKVTHDFDRRHIN
jgi:hypothetical protein